MKEYNMTEEMEENRNMWDMKTKAGRILHGGGLQVKTVRKMPISFKVIPNSVLQISRLLSEACILAQLSGKKHVRILPWFRTEIP